MTTKDYRQKSPLSIFLHYFGNHKALFAVDILCAVGIAAIDLTFPLVTRKALYDLLPNQLYRTFFFIMLAVAYDFGAVCHTVGELHQLTVEMCACGVCVLGHGLAFYMVGWHGRR